MNSEVSTSLRICTVLQRFWPYNHVRNRVRRPFNTIDCRIRGQFFEGEVPETREPSSTTTFDGALIPPPLGGSLLISGLGIEFEQNHGGADCWTGEDEIPSLLDILERKWNRNCEVTDLTGEDDVSALRIRNHTDI
jgi:hypothetical protein